MNHCVTYWFYLLLTSIYSERLVYIRGMEERYHPPHRLLSRSIGILIFINFDWRYPVKSYFLKFILAAGVVLGLAACGGSDDPAPAAAPTKNIVELAVATPALSTLVDAVTKAGLTSTLSGPGPFTVFAPTNDAFAKLGTATIATLLNETPTAATLSGILKYHVVSGKVLKADIKLGQDITTVNTGKFKINQVGTNFIITDAKGGTSTIVITDNIATNGVVHVIDTVISP